MSGADVKIGDRVHARTPNTAVPWLGTVTAIERSALGTVYVTDVGHNNTIRATEATVAEVSDEPTWRQTAENLREAHALVTEERDRNAEGLDAAFKERDELRQSLALVVKERWNALARAAKLETELTAATGERDAARKERDEATRTLDATHVKLDEVCAFLSRTAIGGSIVSSVTTTPAQIAAARATDRMLVTPHGYGFVYVSDGVAYEMTCDLERITVECDALRRTLERVTAERDEARTETTAKSGGFWGKAAAVAAKERDEALARAAKLETELAAVTEERNEARARNYRLRADLDNAASRESVCQRAANSLTMAGLVSNTTPKSVFWGWVDQLKEGARRAGEIIKERDAARQALDAARVMLRRFGEERDAALQREEALKVSREEALMKRDALTVERDALRQALGRVTAERDEARNEAAAKSGGFWIRVERDALDRRCAETIRALERVTAERDALRRRAAQLAELLRADDDPDETP